MYTCPQVWLHHRYLQGRHGSLSGCDKISVIRTSDLPYLCSQWGYPQGFPPQLMTSLETHCLVYPIVYCKNVEDPSHCNTSASPSGMHTCTCMCHTLLQHADMGPLCWRTFKGSHLIIPCSTQYRTLFPEIVALHNHQGLLIDPDMNEPFPIFTVGDFSLKDKIFPSTPSSRKRTSTSLLTRRRRLNLPPPGKADMGLVAPRRASPHPPTGWRSPAEWKKLARQMSVTRPAAKLPQPPHHGFQTPPAAKSHPRRGKPLQPRRGQITMSPRMAVPPDTSKGPIMKIVGNLSLTRRVAALSTNGGSHHLQASTSQGISPRNLTLKHFLMLPIRAPAPAPGVLLSV